MTAAVPGPAPELVGSAAHVFVADLAAPELGDGDAHHLARVLRLRDGEVVSASDGRGSWRLCRFRVGGTGGTGGTGGRSAVWLEPDGEVTSAARDEPEITIAFAVPKGDRPELLVQKLTEIGVDRVVPFTSARSVVRWDGERAAKQHARLDRVALEAAMQSRRVVLPVVEAPTTFADVVGRPGAALAAPRASLPTVASPLIMVGPEGGWSPEELAAAPTVVGLGPHVLRTETAGLVAGALLVADRMRSVGKWAN